MMSYMIQEDYLEFDGVDPQSPEVQVAVDRFFKEAAELKKLGYYYNNDTEELRVMFKPNITCERAEELTEKLEL